MKITEAAFALIDTETTRPDADDPENELLEIAIDLFGPDDNGSAYDPIASFQSLVYVTRPIPPENSAVHNLTTRDVIDAPEREQVIAQAVSFLPPGVTAVAHNAAFDSKVLSELGCDWICTQRMAQHLLPEAPNYKLATLRYMFGFLDIDYSGLPEERRVHGVAGDLRVLAPVFFELVKRYRDWALDECTNEIGTNAERLEKAEQVETLLKWTNGPIKMLRFPNFGKHARTLLSEIPIDYFEWCLSDRGLTDMDADLRWNLNREMKRRSAWRQGELANG